VAATTFRLVNFRGDLAGEFVRCIAARLGARRGEVDDDIRVDVAVPGPGGSGSV
jgi:hypothetical protein